ncbi:hypothetical protein JCM5350_004312 [Sporobolomyces pararoseus]
MVGRRSSRRTSGAASPPLELPSDIEEPIEELAGEEGGEEEEEEQEEEEEEEESDFEPVEPNLATRVRRANAGNRMRALLEDEQGAMGGESEEMFKEEVDDVEFKQKEEADVFDSDFGSTDEDEYGEDDEEAGERKLQNEAKAEKKAAQKKKKKGFVAPTHPFARTTKDQARKAAKKQQLESEGGGDPVASTSAETLDLPAKRKRGTVDPNFLVPMRESSRRSAVEFKKGVKDRLVESEKRRAVATKPRRKKAKTLTQADLIAEALETEEVNRAALLAFYAAEEDRREAERVAGMRYEIIGPKLTFLSRTEGNVEKKDKGKGKEELGRRRMIEVLGESGQKGWKGNTNGASTQPTTTNDENGSEPITRHDETGQAVDQTSSTSAQKDQQPSSRQRDPNEPMPWTRNWLVFDQFEGNRADEYEVLFGDHVDWSQPAPPRSDPKLQRCALTGLPARYRDPRTLTPYASLEAYQVLNSIVDAQAFIWTDSLGAYTGTSGFGLAREVETMWSRRPAQRVRHAASTDAPPVLLPMSAAPPNPHALRAHATRSSQPRMSTSSGAREDNPYVREYANSGGSRTRGRMSGAADDSAQSGTTSSLPPLPPPSGFPPLPSGANPSSSNASFPTIPPSVNVGSPHGNHLNSSPHIAPQARSIQMNGGGGFFGGGGRAPSPFGPTSSASSPAPAPAPPPSQLQSQSHGFPMPPSNETSAVSGLPPLPPF